MRLDGTFDDFDGADYADIGGAYYFVSDVQSIGDRTVQLTLTVDPINTIGGVANLKVISGWLTRAHPQTDDAFDNVLGEPWAPRHPLKLKFKQIVNQKTGTDLSNTITVSSVDLWKVNDYARVLTQMAESGAVDDIMLVPDFPPTPGTQTVLQVEDPSDTTGDYSYELPNMCFYLGGGNITAEDGKPSLSRLRGLGIESAIVAMYKLPPSRATFEFKSGELHTLTKVKGKTETIFRDGSGPKPVYADVKNKKAVCLHNTIVIASIASGDSDTFDTADLVEPSGRNLRFFLTADPAPNGGEYLRPVMFQGEMTTFTEHSVKGVAWVQAGYAFQGGSGRDLTIANVNRTRNIAAQIQERAMTKIQNNITRGAINGVVDTGRQVAAGIKSFLPTTSMSANGDRVSITKMGPDISGGINHLVDAAQTGFNAWVDYNNGNLDKENAALSYKQQMTGALWDAASQANIVAPEIAFPVEPGLVGYFGNAFLVAQVGLDERDVAQFDKFLTANGYATSEQYYEGCMTDRAKFNFVQFSDVQIDADASMTLRMMAEDVLKSGVRIWHKLATTADYNDNPRRS